MKIKKKIIFIIYFVKTNSMFINDWFWGKFAFLFKNFFKKRTDQKIIF